MEKHSKKRGKSKHRSSEGRDVGLDPGEQGERVLGRIRGPGAPWPTHSTEPESGLSVLFRVRWITRQ